MHENASIDEHKYTFREYRLFSKATKFQKSVLQCCDV